MILQTWFSWTTNLAMVGWAALVLSPGLRWTHRLVAWLAGVGLALVYGGWMLAGWPGAGGGYGSLEAVSRLFESEKVLLAGWVHYLAFDLFVGCWISWDARRLGVAWLAVVPCLALTLFFGPVGLAGYLLLRWFVAGEPWPWEREATP